MKLKPWGEVNQHENYIQVHRFSTHRFSLSALRTFHSSKTPMMFCQILTSQDSVATMSGHDDVTNLEPSASDLGHISEMALNEKAQTLLGRVQVTWRLNRHRSRNYQQRNVFMFIS